ncbi:hypothetical protein TNIN_452881 [Trichonephila inaurata madagascariensis]|uniref:Uncharacterized protein n=1 Tax=Trichonephila inaurata madagascariensis TaxID=2747483 RepID=A0A8X6YX46_9ARAC|nr:hypothetical protein TNIN_452881 [Trichonephila inaurata madagascariensis]
MKVSFIEVQVSPRALEHSSGWISKLELSLTQFEEIRESTSDELDRHLLKWNPLASSMFESVFIVEIASSLEGAPAIKSSMQKDYFIRDETAGSSLSRSNSI